MNTLARYLELIVDPTWDDFHSKRRSVRRPFLACVAIYHAIDRVVEGNQRRAAHLPHVWCRESLDFKRVDVIAHHFST